MLTHPIIGAYTYSHKKQTNQIKTKRHLVSLSRKTSVRKQFTNTHISLLHTSDADILTDSQMFHRFPTPTPTTTSSGGQNLRAPI